MSFYRCFQIENKIVAQGILLLVAIFCVLAVPFKDGRSTYAYSELTRDLNTLRTIDSGQLIQLGPVSGLGDFHFGPAYYYIAYPFVKILGYKPYSLAVTSALFMLLTIIIAFYWVKSWLRNEILAFLTSAIMTFSILTFQLTKYGSNPNFVPFFVILFFFSMKKIIDDPKQITWLMLFSVSFAVLTQLHAVTLVAMPIILLLSTLITPLKKVPLYNAAIFIIINLAAYAPYLSYEFTHNYANTRALLYIASGTHMTWAMYISHLLQYIGFFINSVLAEHTFFSAMDRGGRGFIFSCLFLILLIPIVLRLNLKNRRFYFTGLINIEISGIVKKLLMIWFFVPLTIFILPVGRTLTFQYYYFLIFFPLLYLFLAGGVFGLFKRGLHIVAIYLIVVFIILQFSQNILYIQGMRLLKTFL